MTGDATAMPRPDDMDSQAEEVANPLRCICGKLICIRYGDVIEIKCSKCKRMVRIKTAGILDVDIR